MSTTELAQRCPDCGAAGPVDLGDGTLLCLGCRTEWDPADPELLARAQLDRILGPGLDGGLLETAVEPANGDGGPELAPGGPLAASTGDGGPNVPPADLTGLFVRDTLHPDRAVWLVVEDDGGRALLVQDRTGKDFPVDRATVEFVGSDPDVVQEITVEGTSDETTPLPGVILAVAGLALEAGVDCVGEGEDPELYQPRIGWMPPPCDGVPEVEQAVAYAIAILVRHFALDKDLVRQLASGLLVGAEVAPEGETKR